MKDPMKDVTSTSFGLVIAFLLPGLAGLYSLAFWVKPVDTVLRLLLTAASTAGLFLLFVLAALAIGLHIAALRFLIFERILCRHHCLSPAEFAALGTQNKLVAFRAAVDEHYRYHQFWGGMAVVLPVFFVGWMHRYWYDAGRFQIAMSAMLFLLTEALNIFAGIEGFKRYVNRARSILKGESAMPPDSLSRMGNMNVPEVGERLDNAGGMAKLPDGSE